MSAVSTFKKLQQKLIYYFIITQTRTHARTRARSLTDAHTRLAQQIVASTWLGEPSWKTIQRVQTPHLRFFIT